MALIMQKPSRSVKRKRLRLTLWMVICFSTLLDSNLATAAAERAAASQQRRQLLRAQSAQLAGASGLAACLKFIKGLRAVYPGNSAFSAAASAQNLRTLSTPAAVVFPETTQDVAAIVKCCVRNGKKAVPRGGGHSYAGFSVQTDKVTVDMSGMNKVSLSQNGKTAKVQSGALLGPVYLKLWQSSEGRFGFPGGTCPTVGFAGLLLGGGFGMSSRKHGLSCDRLTAVEMVTASGQIVNADSKNNTDLLWASKGGGGGNFGIVTSLSVKPINLPKVVTVVSVQWSASKYAEAMGWYMKNMAGLDPNFSSDLFCGYGSAQLHGLYFGAVDKARAVLTASGIEAVGQPQFANYEAKSWIDAMTVYAVQAQALSPPQASSLGLGSGVNLAPKQTWKAKSNFISQPFDSKGLAIAAAAINEANSRGIGGWLQLHAYGGAINKKASTETAFVHRNERASLQYYVSWTDNRAAAAASGWLQKTWTSLQPYVSSSAYANYIDVDLGAEGIKAYYGANLERLMAIKRQYDPNNYFNYPNSIPVGHA